MSDAMGTFDMGQLESSLHDIAKDVETDNIAQDLETSTATYGTLCIVQGVIDLGLDIDLITVGFTPSDSVDDLPFMDDGLADCVLDHDSIILESRDTGQRMPGIDNNRVRVSQSWPPLRLKDGSICREMVTSIPGLDRRHPYSFEISNQSSIPPIESCKVTLICSAEHHTPEDYDTSFDRQISLFTDHNATITGFIRSEVSNAHKGLTSRWWTAPVEQPPLAGSSGILAIPQGEHEKRSKIRITSEQLLIGRSQRSIAIKLDSDFLDEQDKGQWRIMDWDPTRYRVLIDGLDSDTMLNIVKKNRESTGKQKVVDSPDGVTGSLTYFVPGNCESSTESEQV
jgi:hypothetical protein